MADCISSNSDLRARKRLTVTVQPLLNGIRAHTGLTLCLLAGTPQDDGKFYAIA